MNRSPGKTVQEIYFMTVDVEAMSDPTIQPREHVIGELVTEADGSQRIHLWTVPIGEPLLAVRPLPSRLKAVP